MTARLARTLLLAGLVLALSGPAASQTPAKRPITHADYAAWRALQSPALSADGSFLAYALAPQEGDGEFVARDLRTGKEYRHPRGSSTVAFVPTRQRGGRVAVQVTSHAFTPDAKFAVFTIYPPPAERQKADQGKGPPAPGTRNALGVMELTSGKVSRIEGVGSFQVAQEGPPLLVYHAAPARQAPAQDKDKAGKGARQPPVKEPEK